MATFTFTPGAERLLGLAAKDQPKEKFPDSIFIHPKALNPYYSAMCVIIAAEDPRPKAALENAKRLTS